MMQAITVITDNGIDLVIPDYFFQPASFFPYDMQEPRCLCYHFPDQPGPGFSIFCLVTEKRQEGQIGESFRENGRLGFFRGYPYFGPLF